MIEPQLSRALQRGKSVLLLGARQTGKTTLCRHLGPALSVSFADPGIRSRYERQPDLLGRELRDFAARRGQPPLIVLDEVQRWPPCLDVAQQLIDAQQAVFVLTGSSARKLRRGRDLNLLPGRVVTLHLDPFTHSEDSAVTLEEHLLYGDLPGVRAVENAEDREVDLASYVTTYLEQEVRAEALVRKVGMFARFLALAGGESGNVLNFSKLAQDVGVTGKTIASYYEILEDCLLMERVEPFLKSKVRRKLTRSAKFIVFDLGVRRLCAGEGIVLPASHMGRLFEQWVGLELIRLLRARGSRQNLQFWRDPDGPEVDYVMHRNNSMLPIEVKWTEAPTAREARHLQVFMEEHESAMDGVIICRTPRPFQVTSRVRALPWQDLGQLGQ